MISILENFMRRNLPNDWYEHAQPLYGIAAKISDGDTYKKFADQAKQIFQEADQAKIHKYGWSYLYSRNFQEAEKEASVVAQICLDNNLDLFMMNCEKHTFGVWGEPSVPEPDKNILRFVEIFNKRAPNVQLGWNGFSTEKIGHRNALTKEVASKFQIWSPMCYGSLGANSSAVERTIKWRDELPSLAISPTVDCKADYKDLEKFIGYTKPDSLTIWLGNGGKDTFMPLMNWLKTLP